MRNNKTHHDKTKFHKMMAAQMNMENIEEKIINTDYLEEYKEYIESSENLENM